MIDQDLLKVRERIPLPSMRKDKHVLQKPNPWK